MAWGHALLGAAIVQMQENAARAGRRRESRRRQERQRPAQPVILVRSFEAPPTVLRPRPRPGAN